MNVSYQQLEEIISIEILFYIFSSLFFNPQPLISFFFGDSQKEAESLGRARGPNERRGPPGVTVSPLEAAYGGAELPRPSPGVSQCGWRALGGPGHTRRRAVVGGPLAGWLFCCPRQVALGPRPGQSRGVQEWHGAEGEPRVGGA